MSPEEPGVLEPRPKVFSRGELEEKLASLFAGETGLGRERLDINAPISGYGLDSVSVASLLGEIETWAGRRIDPSLMWKQPSIAMLVDHLTQDAPIAPYTPLQNGIRNQLSGFSQLEERFKNLSDAQIENPFFRTFDGAGAATIADGNRVLINFASYNYLGLADHEEVKLAAKQAIDLYGTSVSASRVSSGERPVHQDLERTLARFVGAEDALVFVGGHATNVSVIGHLCSSEDLIVHDSLMHNSGIIGARLSGARCLAFPHNDLDALDRILTRERAAHRLALVLVEGVYSTDGDIPDLGRLVRLKQSHDAWLMVDEAHSIGVLGRQGRGLAEHFGLAASQIDILMGTLSKSLASCGGYVAGGHDLIRYLRYTCPGFIFSAGISPANAAAALKAIEMIEAEPWRVEGLCDNALAFAAMARARGLDTGPAHGSGVIPVMVGEDAAAILLSNDLFAAGLNVQPLISPAVDPGKARLRFFISCLHTPAQLAAAVELTAQKLRSIPQRPATGSPA